MPLTEWSATAMRERVRGIDWAQVEGDLTELGYARLPRLLAPGECRELIGLYSQRERFRSFVELARHGFGDGGDYRYLDYPLPPLVRALRRALYPPLAGIANRWCEELGQTERFPSSLSAFVDRCHAAEQRRPTPLILHYVAGGYNRLHQDLYGEVAFPLQVVCLLSRPGEDFAGGEFLLTEQRPRMQSRGEAISIARGEGIVFPNSVRPVQGVRSTSRAQIRHGMSRVLAGERYALGIIFHDAK